MADVRFLTGSLTSTLFRIRELGMGFVEGANGVTLSLDPGNYHFEQAGSPPAAFPFTITPDGLVDYDEAHGAFLSGRGSGGLVVEGFAVTVDGTALFHDLLPLNLVGAQWLSHTAAQTL